MLVILNSIRRKNNKQRYRCGYKRDCYISKKIRWLELRHRNNMSEIEFCSTICFGEPLERLGKYVWAKSTEWMQFSLQVPKDSIENTRTQIWRYDNKGSRETLISLCQTEGKTNAPTLTTNAIASRVSSISKIRNVRKLYFCKSGFNFQIFGIIIYAEWIQI